MPKITVLSGPSIADPHAAPPEVTEAAVPEDAAVKASDGLGVRLPKAAAKTDADSAVRIRTTRSAPSSTSNR